MSDNQNRKRRIFNPDEHAIHMKRVRSTAGRAYFIGNCKMGLNIKNTVLKFYPPKTTDEDDKFGVLIINDCKIDLNKDQEYYDDDYEILDDDK